MLISESAFDLDYGHEFSTALDYYKDIVSHPEKLRARLEETRATWAPTGNQIQHARPPRPNEFEYQLTYAKGFVRFPKRLRNFVLSKHDRFRVKKRSMPTRLDIEPASHCNFACVMCQVSDWPGGKRAENLTVPGLKHFLEEQDGLCEVKLQGFGEPLINKDFFKLSEALVSQDIWVRTTTNGSILPHNENWRKLIDSGLGDITCSFDGATKTVFESIRRKSNFDQVVKGFTLLNQYANSKNILVTRMWVVVQRDNRNQIKELVQLAKQMGFRRLTFSVGLSDWGSEKWHDNNSKLQTTDLSSEEIQMIAIEAGNDLEVTFWNLKNKFSLKSLESRCHWPFEWSFVGSDLRISPCCMIGDPDRLDLSDEAGFKSAWNSKKYQEFRRSHLEGRIPALCKNCYQEDCHE